MDIRVVDFKSPLASSEFEQTIRETGFGVVSNHLIDPQLVADVYALWDEFFTTDIKNDARYAFNPKTHAGFIPFEISETAKGYQAKDLKEFYHYYHPWGVVPDFLASKTRKLCTQLIEMGATLLSWVEQHAPEFLKATFSEHLTHMIQNSNKHLFRLIYYPPLKGDEPVDAVRAAEHEDINFLTLLPAATAKGLEAKAQDGSWVSVPCNPGWIIVNVGDMLQETSDGYYPSTPHRVVNPEGVDARNSRMSMPLFLHPRDEVRLSKRHTAQSYREERYRELGLLEANKHIELEEV